jgi:hypothetical protein
MILKTTIFLTISLNILTTTGCRIDCSHLPDNRPKEVLVLPIRVEPEPSPVECKKENEMIDYLAWRLKQECGSYSAFD